ncbi:MAG: DUF2232 domain-containing protein [Gemmatimonadaceae bacterium]
MSAAATAPAQKHSWWPLVWGFLAFLIMPYALEGVLPIAETFLLLLPILAACALVGWRLGARAVLAVILVVLAIWVLATPAGSPGTPYDQMARGWAILLAASFGLVSLWSTSTGFFVRALTSVGIAISIGFIIALASPSGLARFQHADGEELTRRVADRIAQIEQARSTPAWRDLAERSPVLDPFYDDLEKVLRATPDRAAELLPALLAIESLVALALGWSLFRALSSVAIGPPLSPLTEFRFNDQLVWGLAVGATLFLLPAFVEGKNAGLNLLLFFGTLYLVRGIGLLGWITRGRYVLMGILSLIPPFSLMLFVLALVFGLGDTWLDLRRRFRSS